MTEKEMADELRSSIELFRLGDGIYIFDDNGRFGTLKNYEDNSERYQVTFENLTREQVLTVFETE